MPVEIAPELVEAVEAHLYAFAAAEARLSGETIDLGPYRERLVSPEK